MPDYTRPGLRDPLHDYRNRAVYLITITQPRNAPHLAEISGGSLPRSIWQPAGEAFMNAVGLTFGAVPQIKVLQYVLMPDHAHFVIHITSALERPIGDYIGAIKGRATGSIRRLLNRPDAVIFNPNFHDRIMRFPGQLARMINYVKDNPRRLALRRQNPDFFTIQRSIVIRGHEFDACGNIFLLDDFERTTVRVHRQWTDAELEAERKRWHSAAINGATFVSPFIHPKEKEILREGLGLGARVILLINEPMGERFKPGGRYFDLCSQGRLLILHPSGMLRNGLTRSDAMMLNEFAQMIVT